MDWTVAKSAGVLLGLLLVCRRTTGPARMAPKPDKTNKSVVRVRRLRRVKLIPVLCTARARARAGGGGRDVAYFMHRPARHRRRPRVSVLFGPIKSVPRCIRQPESIARRQYNSKLMKR